MNLFRTKIEPKSKPNGSPELDLSFDMDDAIQKVGRPICSKEWRDKEAVIAREMQEAEVLLGMRSGIDSRAVVLRLTILVCVKQVHIPLFFRKLEMRMYR
jgi:hypothetical protein